MAKVPLVTGRGNTQAAATTNYYTILEGNFGSTELNVQFTTHIAGTLSNFFIYVYSNSANFTTTLRVRKNTANGNQVISVTAAATGQFEDTSNTDTLVDGDIINYSYVTAAGTGSIGVQNMAILFEATTNVVTFYKTARLGIGTASQTSYWAMVSSGIQTTEANALLVFKTAGTLKKLFVKISTNTRTTTTTYTVRKNSADTGITTSVTGSSTGIFEDTSNTSSIAVDDTSAFKVVTSTGTGTITHEGIFISFETTNNKSTIHRRSYGALAFGTTNYGGFYVGTTEANAQIEANVAFTASNLGARVSANTANGTSTYLLRQNAGDTALSVSITASTTGWFIDTSHTVSIIATDEVNYKIVVGGSSGNLTIEVGNMLLDYSSGSSIKTFDGLAVASVKTVDGLAIASVKNYNGLS
jgi:hypothetical protein